MDGTSTSTSKRQSGQAAPEDRGSFFTRWFRRLGRKQVEPARTRDVRKRERRAGKLDRNPLRKEGDTQQQPSVPNENPSESSR